MSGGERMIYSQSSSLVLRDISKDGRVLVTSFDQRMKLVYRGDKDNVDRDLSWFDWSLLSAISRDGKFILF